MQDPIIFNLKSMDDNDEMKEDIVEINARRKIKMKFHSIRLDICCCTQLNAFPHLPKTVM